MKVKLNKFVRNAVDCIIKNENYKTPPEIDVVQGSEAGDGYSCKTYSISITSENGKTIQLFVKYIPEGNDHAFKIELGNAFQAEFRFYQEIYPAFSRFQQQKSIKAPFCNVPKHYGTRIKDCECPPIILENLRSLGYTLRDRRKPVDDNHLKLPIQAFARYHAVSYALKDQEPEEFHKLSANLVDFLSENFIKFGMHDMVSKCIDQFVDSLDPISDKKLLNRCKNLAEVLIQHATSIPQNVDEYAVITQGDCWSNNMMFLYDNKTGLPTDVKLIDWQCPRTNSPLLDFSYFFYTLATKEVLDNAEYYLELYYDTLSQRIKELGSDPEKMYPHEAFIEHWRKYSLFGLTMAFFIVKIQLFEKDEVPDLMNATEPNLDAFCIIVKHQDKYIKRMRDLIEYFIDKELL